MSTGNSFLPNVILVVGINLLVKPLYIFGIDRTVQNTVGSEDYGLYFALLNFVYLFQIFNDLGIQNYNHSVYSKLDYLIPKYLPKLLGTKLVLGLLFLFFTVFSGLVMGYEGFTTILLLVLAVNQIMASMLIFLRTNLSARGYYHLDSLLSILDKSLMITIVGYLLWFANMDRFEIRHFVYAQSLSFLIALTITMVLLSRYGVANFSKIRVDINYTRWLLKKSFPYALVLLLMTLYTRMDGVMIERLISDGKLEAGIYAASYRILDALSMIGLLFAGLLLPMFAKTIAAHQSVDYLTQTAGSILWALSFFVVVVSVAFANEIMALLYDGADLYWGKVYGVLLGSYIAVSLSYVYGTLLTANESIGKMNWIFALGVILNFSLNFFLILHWKALGAAIATVITQSLTAVALIFVAYRELKLSFSIKGLVRSIVYAMVVLLMALGVMQWSVDWLIQLTALSIGSLITALLMRQIPTNVKAFLQ